MARDLAYAARTRALIASGLCLVASTWAAGPARAAFSTERIVAPGSVDRPVFVTAPPGDSDRLFILEQHRGQILILNLADGSLNATPFLTLTGLSTGNEQGLLGLAFHPDYALNGLFYVNYTRSDRDTVIARFQVSADPELANAASETQLLRITQPQTNHNGGWIAFGPDDGFLYIGSGDGGGSNDDDSGHTAGTGNAQDITDNLLGKILRIDVNSDDFPGDAARNYAIPASNPFVDVAGDDEIWSHGLRNPWRAGFDRETGELYIGDVGQNAREEIDIQPALVGGHNYGWRLREGTIETPGSVGGAAPAGALDPIFDYTHATASFTGCSVTGGYAYRGPIQELQGSYFFADYCTSDLWSLRFDGSDPSQFDGTNYTDLTDHTGDPRFTPDQGSFANLSSFGEDAAGNLYIVNLGTRNQFGALEFETGQIFRVPEPAAKLLWPTALVTLISLSAARRRNQRNRYGTMKTFGA